MGTAGNVELAESEGFEPPNRLPRYLISSQAPSTTRPALRSAGDYIGIRKSGQIACKRAADAKKRRRKRLRATPFERRIVRYFFAGAGAAALAAGACGAAGAAGAICGAGTDLPLAFISAK